MKYITLVQDLFPSVSIVSSPKTLLEFPTAVSGLSYEPISSTLAFNADVWQNGDLESAIEQDKAYEQRGNTAQVSWRLALQAQVRRSC